MEKSWVTEIQEDRLSHEIVQFCSFKKQTGTFYITKVLGLGQLRPQLVCVILFLFLEDVKLETFQCLPSFL